METQTNIEKYIPEYSESKFWSKLTKFAKKAGVKIVYVALLLYYVVKSDTISKTDKRKIYAALGYFILPIDMIPDLIPFYGFSDDILIMLWALFAVWSNITPEIEAKANEKLKKWFNKEMKKEDLK